LRGCGLGKFSIFNYPVTKLPNYQILNCRELAFKAMSKNSHVADITAGLLFFRHLAIRKAELDRKGRAAITSTQVQLLQHLESFDFAIADLYVELCGLFRFL
jgi:hypothetical protein